MRGRENLLVETDPLYQKLLDASFRFVSFRPRSSKELRDFLQKKLAQWNLRVSPVLERVLEQLRTYGYYDDKKFVVWWIAQRQGRKPKGLRLIVQELKNKGVDGGLIEEVLGEHAMGETESVSDETLAQRAVVKKLILWKTLPELEQKQKIYRYLARRGFSQNTIHRVIDEHLKKDYNQY